MNWSVSRSLEKRMEIERQMRELEKRRMDAMDAISGDMDDAPTGRGIQYYVRVGDKFVKTTVFTQHEPAYITVKTLHNIA